jgi:Sec-independent protein translocase protein TatA
MIAVGRLSLVALGFTSVRMPELLVVLAVAILLFGSRDRFGRDLAQALWRFRDSMEEMSYRRALRMSYMRELRWQARHPQPDPILLAIIVLLGVLVVLLITLIWLHT